MGDICVFAGISRHRLQSALNYAALYQNSPTPMEYRFRKSFLGFEAHTDDEQLLFGVLLSEEAQQLSVIDALQQHVREAELRPEVEQKWQGRHYVMSLLQEEVMVAHISDVVSEDDFSEQVESEGFGEVRQESFAGLVDFTELLAAWREFVSE